MTSLLLASLFAASTAAFRPPNLVLVVADDLGYGDIGCYGGTRIPTPNIDAIAARGIRMTDGYVTAPMCAPSRAGLMTSRYQQRFGFEFNPAAGGVYGIPKNQKTLAERLRSVGYATAAVGKWHLGEHDGQTPMDRGFQSFFGFYGGAMRYLPLVPSGLDVISGKTPVKVQGYLTDVFTKKAVDYVNHSYTRPFFLYLAYNAVHLPYEAPQTYLDRFPQYTGDMKVYAAMVSALDDGIGRVRSALRSKGLENDTLFVFVSDNGGNSSNGPSLNTPLRGAKNTMFEGGLRVPFLVSWPGRLPQSVYFTKTVSTLDIGPTFMSAIGVPLPSAEKVDGKDLLPYLDGTDPGNPHPNLYWRMGNERAMRSNGHKYIGTDRTTGRIWTEMLFNLATDAGELRDILAEQSTKAQQLKNAWSNWSSSLMNPLWPPG